jgi:hypothetical protein
MAVAVIVSRAGVGDIFTGVAGTAAVVAEPGLPRPV